MHFEPHEEIMSKRMERNEVDYKENLHILLRILSLSKHKPQERLTKLYWSDLIIVVQKEWALDRYRCKIV